MQKEIIKNGKVYRYITTHHSDVQSRKLVDTFQSEDGKLLHIERIPTIIGDPNPHEIRKSCEGYLISFKRNFSRLVDNIVSQTATDDTLERLVLQCKHPLDSGLKCYEKKEGIEIFTQFVADVDHSLDEVRKEHENVDMISIYQQILSTKEIKNNSLLNNALFLQIHKIQHPELEEETQNS